MIELQLDKDEILALRSIQTLEKYVIFLWRHFIQDNRPMQTYRTNLGPNLKQFDFLLPQAFVMYSVLMLNTKKDVRRPIRP